MKISNISNRGSALILAMLVIAVVTGLVGVIYSLTTTTILQTNRGNDYARAQAAAEGAIEYAYGIWLREITKAQGPITSNAINTKLRTMDVSAIDDDLLENTIRKIDVSAVDQFGKKYAGDVKPDGVFTLLDGSSKNQYVYVASVTASVPGVGNRATDFSLRRTFIYSHRPIFGAMFFFEGDFELFQPAPMIINGDVHTNSRGYVSTHYTTTSDKLTFQSGSRVTYVGDYYGNAEPPHAKEWSGYGKNNNKEPVYQDGFANQVRKTDYMQALGAGSKDEFNQNDNNPNTDGNRELIEPPNPNYPDPPAISASRLYNKAGLIVEITGPLQGDSVVASGNGFAAQNITITPKNDTTLTQSQAQTIRNAIVNSKTEIVQVPRVTTEEYQVQIDNGRRAKPRYTYETRTRQVTVYDDVEQIVPTRITDKREGVEVNVSTLDIGQAKSTLDTMAKDGFNGLIYVHDTTSTQTDSHKKAIRLVNGGELPAQGLSIASENGVYVQGDYNTGTTNDPKVVPANKNGNANNNQASYKTGYDPKQAVVAGDMVTILSNNWNDANSNKDVASRKATNTTTNMAIISGFVPSGYTSPDGTTNGYSGGANNFPRFLEDWGSVYFTYFGSMVQLYNSEIFTGRWETQNIYNAPTRRWNFQDIEKLAHGNQESLVNTTAFSRGYWQRF